MFRRVLFVVAAASLTLIASGQFRPTDTGSSSNLGGASGIFCACNANWTRCISQNGGVVPNATADRLIGECVEQCYRDDRNLRSCVGDAQVNRARQQAKECQGRVPKSYTGCTDSPTSTLPPSTRPTSGELNSQRLLLMPMQASRCHDTCRLNIVGNKDGAIKVCARQAR